MKIKVREGLEIGDDCPVFIIAEVGSNWRTLEDCIESIFEAKRCGADAVKFQAFDFKSLYGIPRILEDRGPGALPLEWLPKLKACADYCGIEFMCSAFSSELLDCVNPYVNIHKLASAEMCHVRMLERLKAIGKPVIMSTGAHTVQEIRQAFDSIHAWKTPLVLMYCVASYPAKEIELGNIPLLRSNFNTLAGYSDHSLDIAVLPKQATEKGACVIEKHFTAIDFDTPDRGHSLNPTEFKHMVGVIRGAHLYPLGPTPEEVPMLLRHNRRLIATSDIKKGEALIEDLNFGIYRSLKDAPDSLNPFKIEEVKGRIVTRNIKAGDALRLEDIAC